MAEPAQPPTSWDELNQRLAGLLERLETVGSEEANDFEEECKKWRTDVEAVRAAAVAAVHDGPSPAEREALTGCVAQEGCDVHPMLVTLDQQGLAPKLLPYACTYVRRALLQAGERLAALDVQPGVVIVMRAACILMLGCSTLARTCGLEPDAASRYTACLALILHGGTRLLLEAAPQRTTQAADDARELEDALRWQAFALPRTLMLLRGVSPATAGSVLPPDQFVCWWKAVAGMLEAIECVRGCPGGWRWLTVPPPHAGALF